MHTVYPSLLSGFFQCARVLNIHGCHYTGRQWHCGHIAHSCILSIYDGGVVGVNVCVVCIDSSIFACYSKQPEHVLHALNVSCLFSFVSSAVFVSHYIWIGSPPSTLPHKKNNNIYWHKPTFVPNRTSLHSMTFVIAHIFRGRMDIESV